MNGTNSYRILAKNDRVLPGGVTTETSNSGSQQVHLQGMPLSTTDPIANQLDFRSPRAEVIALSEATDGRKVLYFNFQRSGDPICWLNAGDALLLHTNGQSPSAWKLPIFHQM